MYAYGVTSQLEPVLRLHWQMQGCVCDADVCVKVASHLIIPDWGEGLLCITYLLAKSTLLLEQPNCGAQQGHAKPTEAAPLGPAFWQYRGQNSLFGGVWLRTPADRECCELGVRRCRSDER